MDLNRRINQWLDQISDFLANWPGVLPLAGLLFVIINLILQIYPGPGSGWLVDSNLLLHIGLIIIVVGTLLIRAISRD